ncbi:MAG TPA: WD40 repeat domain-containing protein [Pyrinomonadaceae bacterium]|nr:WD40 repeat domain-containing protein [Pyrinomonadaceae bacterium]
MSASIRKLDPVFLRYAAFLLALTLSWCCYAQAPATNRLASVFVRQPNHTTRAYSVTFSHDGKILLSASWDGTIKLWDTKSGRELRTLVGHSWGVYKAVFSPDEKQLASASRDGTVKIWDVATGANTRTLVADSFAVKSVAWSPDGRLLASSGNDGVVKLWDAASGQELRALKHAWREGRVGLVNCVLFSPDGKTLASRNWDGTVSLWDVSTGRESHTLALVNDFGGISSLAFSHDGRLVAEADEGTKVKFWDVASGQLVRTLVSPPTTGMTIQIVSQAFSLDGRLLATGEARIDDAHKEYYGVVKLWNLESGQVVHEAVAHVLEPDSLAFSADGRLLASGGADGGVKLWDSTLKEVKTLSISPLAARGVKTFSFNMPNPERILPQTPPGFRMLEWLGSFNSGNVYLMNGYAQARFAKTALARKSAEDRAIEDFKRYQELGELELSSVERASDNEIVVLAQSLRTKERRSVTLKLEEAEPHGVTSIEVGPVRSTP